MPRGFTGVRRAAADAEARRAAAGPFALYFKLDPEKSTSVRFLEQGDDIHWAEFHEIPVAGRQWGDLRLCLDQDKSGTPCPGCEQGLKRVFRGFINVIWQDAPIFDREPGQDGKPGKMKRDGNNKPIIVGHEPQVAVWTSGIRLFEELDEIDGNYKGLMSRRFKVKRKGSGTDTKYSIVPEEIDGGAQPFTDAEKKLAEGKFDLNPFVTPPSYEDWAKGNPNATASNNTAPSNDGAPAGTVSANPFMRNK